MRKILYQRIVIEKIKPYLKKDDIIVLHGARQVGKTHILYFLKQLLEKEGEMPHYIDLEDSRYIRMLNNGVESFITYLQEEGYNLKDIKRKEEKITIFIDEIQYLENPSSFLKLCHDHYAYLKLIISGSSSFNIKSKFKDSLVGRTVNFEIYPLSFEEFLIFKEYHADLRRPMTEKKINELKELYREFVLYGGYPKIVLTDDVKQKETYLQQIIDTYIRKDIRDLGNIKEIDKFNHLLEVLSSQSSQLLNVSELSNTIGLAKQTIREYLFLLEETYILALLKPFHGNIRSELFKTPKVYFYDTGIMQMLWLKSLQKEILGSVFETNIYSELVKMTGSKNIRFWRTTDKKEIDFIALKAQGESIPVEAKLNAPSILPRPMKYFIDQYNPKKYALVSLAGRKSLAQSKYPWELQSLLS